MGILYRTKRMYENMKPKHKSYKKIYTGHMYNFDW